VHLDFASGAGAARATAKLGLADYKSGMHSCEPLVVMYAFLGEFKPAIVSMA
jgi:hypothetical protein